jgi:hypothetical protein
MSDLSEFFLGSSPAVVQLDCLEISHPNFSQTYRVVRNTQQDQLTALDANGNHKRGAIVTHEGPSGPFEYEYVPARILPVATRDDLVQALSVSLGDTGDIIAAEIERIWAANGLNTRPVLKYRAYPSDDLGVPMLGPLVLELASVTTSREGATFEARAPELNASRTGELYDVNRFPMLKPFLVDGGR